MAAALDQLAAGEEVMPRALTGGMRAIAGELRLVLTSGPVDEMLEWPKERALDVAAFLLEAATALSMQGCHVAAYALEGLEGRLLESLVTGAGMEDAR